MKFSSTPRVALFSLIISTGVSAFPHESQAAIVWGDALTQEVDCESVNFLATCGQIYYYSQPFYPPIPGYADSDEFEVPEISNNIFAFDEKQNVVLPEDVKIAKPNESYVENEFFANINPDRSQLNESNLAYNWDAKRDDMPVLPQGTLVNSHFLGYSPFSGDGRREFARAVVEFDTPIIGFIDTRDSKFTNHIFSFTQYDINLGRTLEGLVWSNPATRDYVKVSEDNPYILEIELSTYDAFEGVRVLTQASVSAEG